MTEQKIKELLKSLFSLQYYSRGSYACYLDVISKNNQDKVETVIRQFLLENHDSKTGELEAKVYAYEQMISKSNFAPMLKQHIEEEIKEDDITIKEALEKITTMFDDVHHHIDNNKGS